MLQVQTPAAAMAAAGLDGHRSIPVADAVQSSMHLQTLARQGTYLELRLRKGARWEKAFYEDVDAAAQAAQRFKDGADIYVGVLPRTHAKYGGDALPEHGSVVWCEADTEAATARVMSFAPAAPLLVRSSPGKVHAYWFLRQPIPLEYIERANKRLAYHLGCDPRATNAGRILRVAGTINHKPTGGRVAITRCEMYDNVTAAALVGHLSDPAPPQPIVVRNPRPPLPPDADTDRLREVPAREYIAAISGIEVYRDKAWCPFCTEKEDAPSLSTGGPRGELYLCFGCEAAGDVFRYAATRWGLDEASDFKIIKTKLKELL